MEIAVWKKTKILLLLIMAVGMLGIGMNDAFADVPAITSFVANDPDDGDIIYSNDDTFTLTFNLPINVTSGATMSQGAIDGNFTLSGGASFGTTYTGQWTGQTILTITVTNVAGATDPTIGGTTIVGCTVPAAGCIGHDAAEDNPTGPTVSPALSGDFGIVSVTSSSGDSTHKWKTKPTFGLGHNLGKQLVTCGFKMDYTCYDITDNFHTPFEKVTINTGSTHDFDLKINAIYGVKRVEFGLVPEVGSMYKAEVLIEAWFNSDKTLDKVVVRQGEHIIDESNISASMTKNGSEYSVQINGVKFLEQPYFEVIGIKAVDFHNRAVTTYLNEGIDVVGDSYNEPPTEQILSEEKYDGLQTVSRVDKFADTWVNEDGILYIKNDYNTWFKITPDAGIEVDVDPISKHGIQREHAFFETYEEGQELLANQIWSSDEIQSELPESTTVEYSIIDRMNDSELQNSITEQIEIAQEIFEQEFGEIYPTH